MATPRMLVAFGSGAIVVAAAFGLAVALGEWWIVPVALVVHLGATVVVLAFPSRRILEDRDRPDPVTEAPLEEERAEEHSHNGSRRRKGDEERGVFEL